MTSLQAATIGGTFSIGVVLASTMAGAAGSDEHFRLSVRPDAVATYHISSPLAPSSNSVLEMAAVRAVPSESDFREIATTLAAQQVRLHPAFEMILAEHLEDFLV